MKIRLGIPRQQLRLRLSKKITTIIKNIPRKEQLHECCKIYLHEMVYSQTVRREDWWDVKTPKMRLEDFDEY